ncbi:MAG TPA: hypothetical protein VGD67_06740 [Pseudonocardiaceae bacterium]
MSSPYDPQQQPQQDPRYPQNPQYPQAQPPQYPYQPDAGGYGQPYGQPGYGQWGQQPVPQPPPRRPGVLTAAGVLWILAGAFLLLFGVLTAVADQLPGFEEAMAQQNLNLDPGLLRGVGIAGAVFGLAVIGLAIVVFRGDTWARIGIVVVVLLPTLVMLTTIVFPLLVIVAAVLQFLPAVNEYTRARARARAAG